MAYKALYRTYRPQTFEEVVGQKYVVQTIRNQIKENKISHAYLFSGPRGTGKTTMAKLLAKAINCEDENNKPCNHCTSCNEITNNAHPDVIEIDAATYTKVDDMREIIDKMKYAPTQGKYKVYIIDEVHMLSASAFNALLKTLEEPPEHVIFILATTEIHKVIPTIVSRCQRFDFTVVNDEDVKKKIHEILEKENITIDEEAVNMIVDLAEGGLRDALSILDQVIAYCDKHITIQALRDVYGILSNKEMHNFMSHIFVSDSLWAIKKAKEYEEGCVDIARTTSGLLDILKDLLIMSETTNETLMKRLTISEAREMLSIVNTKEIYRMIDVLVDTSINYKKTNSSKTLFELAILKMCEICKNHKQKEVVVEEVKEEVAPKVEEVEEIKIETKIERGEDVQVLPEQGTITIDDPVAKVELDTVGTVPTPVVEEKEVIEAQAPAPGTNLVVKEEIEEKVEEVKPVKEEVKEKVLEPGTYKENDRIATSKDDVINLLVQASKESLDDVKKKWELIEAFMGNPKYGSIVGNLVGTLPAAASLNAVLIAVDNEVEVSLLETAKLKKMIRDFLKNLLGRPTEYYPITKRNFLNLRNEFKELKLAHKLPEPKAIKIETIKIVDNEEEDEGLAFGRRLFGDSLISVEE